MKKFQIRLPSNLTFEKVISKFEREVKTHSLIIKSRGTLKTIPSSIHWHITSSGQKGTLEATFDQKRLRLWMSYHDNRYADWIDDAVKKITKTFESR